MKPEICDHCKQNESLSQTDLCKDCLREKFRGLIPISGKRYSSDPNLSRVSALNELRGAV